MQEQKSPCSDFRVEPKMTSVKKESEGGRARGQREEREVSSGRLRDQSWEKEGRDEKSPLKDCGEEREAGRILCWKAGSVQGRGGEARRAHQRLARSACQ